MRKPRRKVFALALTVAIFGGAHAAEAGEQYDCWEREPFTCQVTTDALRIPERAPGGAPKVLVTVEATNDAHRDARLIVTYQANRAGSQPRTILAVDVDAFYADSFVVPTYRLVDGRVTAKVLCNQHVGAADVSVALRPLFLS